jgi:hypothetical protein
MAAKKRNRKQLRDRLRYLRRKANEGKATDDEVKELEAAAAEDADPSDDQHESLLDDSPPGPGRDASPGDQSGEPPGGQPDPAPGPVGADNPITPPPAAKAAPPPPPDRTAPFAPPRPPRVDRDERDESPKGKGRVGDWRDQFKADASGAGREAAVMFFADRWMGVLVQMHNALVGVGIQPMIDVTSPQLRACIVLTVDDYLPERVQLKPVHQAAFGSTVILAQTVYHRKKIVEHQKTAAERDAMRARQEAQKEEAKRAREEAERATEAARTSSGEAAEQPKTGGPAPVTVAEQSAPVSNSPPPWETNGARSLPAAGFNPDDVI